jgi:NADH:ubiquinone oxidoreductase subunit K
VGRDIVMLLVAMQIMAKGVILAMVWAGQVSGQPALGQALATTVIVADTAVAVVGLALAIKV